MSCTDVGWEGRPDGGAGDPHEKDYCRNQFTLQSEQLLEMQAVDKKRARLNCIDHMLKQFPYVETPKQSARLAALPERERHADHHRAPVAADMLVPEIY